MNTLQIPTQETESVYRSMSKHELTQVAGAFSHDLAKHDAALAEAQHSIAFITGRLDLINAIIAERST